MQENPLWQYSLAVYGKPGVEPALLQLQDLFGADVNLLLSCCWLATKAKALTEQQLSTLIMASAKWRAECITPLRSVRRFLKSQQQAECMYERVKMLEIEAEQWQQDQMFQRIDIDGLPSSILVADELALQNLQLYGTRLPGVEWSSLSSPMSELVMGAL